MASQPAPKRRGRPPLDANNDSIPVNVSLTSKQFAAASESARRERITVQDLIRRVLPDGEPNKNR